MNEMDSLFCFLLAGGEGSRLKSLTKDTCKPLVKIGSHYHLVDFTLLNCLYSDIFNIALIVQYESIDLIKYVFESNLPSIGNFYILPPKTKLDSKENILYQNTAHSVYLNMDMVDDSFKDIIILSGDHVYSMDYSNFYKSHKENNADLTVGCVQVPIEDASRFGIFNLDENEKIESFEEKPENPKSNFASMGIYIFKKELLFDVLDELVDKIGYNLDFGRDVIPYYLEKYNVDLYKFEGFWKDVGTVHAFWEINMAILDNPICILQFLNFKERFKISQDTYTSVPAFFDSNSRVSSSIIGKKSYINGEIIHSVIGNNVRIEDDVKITDSVVMDNCSIKNGVNIKYAVISKNCIIEEDVIGEPDNILII